MSDSNYSIQVIERIACLLDALANRSGATPLKDLAAKTGLHPSTTHRILNDLAQYRIIERSQPGCYKLGMRLLELGNLVKDRLDVRDAAIEHMRALHKTTGQTINLSVRQGDEIIYVERSYSERSGMQVIRAIGGRAPLHLTSVGKLFLSVDDPKNIRNYALRTGLLGQTHNSITEISKLEQELGQVRIRGFSRDNEELELGVRCIAAGIHDDAGKLVAGLSVSAPADRLEDNWIEALKACALRISETLGFRSSAKL
jgi:DNA-binding IclR family transcriptional regulator